MSDVVIDGYTDEEIEAVLASDDPDLIERMMAGEKVSVGEDLPVNQNQAATVDESNKPEKKQDEEGAASGTEGGGTGDEEDQERFVESKQGGNKIPYGVLENTRKERDTLKHQLAEAQGRLSSLESKSTAMQSHLEKAGIDLAALEQGERLTDAQLAELDALDPAVAKLARITMGLFERVETVQSRIDTAATTQAGSADPLQQAIESNNDLSTWRKTDPDRWETAAFYDDQLKALPAYKDKPLNERFAEAVRLTKQAFGDPVEEIKPRVDAAALAAEKVAKAGGNSIPRSLTDLGKSPSAERPLGEVLADLDPASLADRMADMTPEQIERMLADMG